MPTPSDGATYGLLGLLATRSWTGYELTQQVQRSLRFTWPTSEGHLYREQKRLVALGWATVEDDPVGARTRNRYTITDAGRRALREWLATDPEEPHLQIEGLLRTFFADRGSPDDLVSSMRVTAERARSMLGELQAFVDAYLEEGGPLWMLEHHRGGPARHASSSTGARCTPSDSGGLAGDRPDHAAALRPRRVLHRRRRRRQRMAEHHRPHPDASDPTTTRADRVRRGAATGTSGQQVTPRRSPNSQ